jgi:hypothetical protein
MCRYCFFLTKNKQRTKNVKPQKKNAKRHATCTHKQSIHDKTTSDSLRKKKDEAPVEKMTPTQNNKNAQILMHLI